MRFLETKIPAPVVAILVGAATKLYAMASGIALDPTPARMHVGLAFAQASALIAIVSAYTMWRARTTINPFAPDKASTLVTGGAFRFSRNPIYVSLLFLLLAYAIRLDSWAVWVGPVFFFFYVTRFQIVPEERALESRFGDAYRQYRQRTRRWL